MKIHIIPCLSDNYAYIIADKTACILIDAPEDKVIIAYCEKHKLHITHALITHHHYDHVEGIEAIKANFGCKVLANFADKHRIPHIDEWFEGEVTLKIGGFEFQVIDTPGHTVGHSVFYEKHHKILFSADTLFMGGCGRLFEGTPLQMYNSFQKLAKLPDETLIYCGHEYTLSNLKFALFMMPQNHAIKNRYMSVDNALADGAFTVPSLMSLEKATNPYFLVKTAEEFADMRAKKDKF